MKTPHAIVLATIVASGAAVVCCGRATAREAIGAVFSALMIAVILGVFDR